MTKFWQRLTLKEQAAFLQQLGMLLQAGTPLPESLRLISQQQLSGLLKNLVKHLATEITKGRRLSDSLEAFRSQISPLVIQLIKIGESNGHLRENLLHLSKELDKRNALRKKVITAAIYPTIIIAGTLLVLAGLGLYVLPKILPLFESLRVPLPWSTKLLLFVHGAFLQHIWLLLAVVIISITALKLLLRINKISRIKDKLVLSIPLINRITQSYILANFCRTLGQLLSYGVPVMKAINITASTISHRQYHQQTIALALAINHGQSIAEFLQQKPKLFPSLMVQLVQTGERTGNLSENLTYLGQIYEEQASDLLTQLSVMIEPVLMVLIGVGVGFTALAIITPIYGITNGLQL
jgi:type II secretory pathway component PulF